MTLKGFETDKHRQVLTEILIEIIKFLGDKVAFKGGTAARLFYNLPRMSLDLDFDLFGELSEAETDTLKIIIKKHGTIKEFRNKRFTLFFLLDYEKNYPNIKLEFNKRIWKNNNYETVWLLGVGMRIADKKTMFSNKLVALSERKTIVARDLFDVHYFLKLNYPFNEELIKERTDKTASEYLLFIKKFIVKNYSRKNVLQGLGEILDEGQKSWAKNHLIPETVKGLDDLREKIKNIK